VLLSVQRETDLTVMSHLTGIGTNSGEIHGILQDYGAHGIQNILALRGDPPKDMPGFDPSKGEFPYARDLVRFIRGYGSFSIGVAVYPEGHQESPSLDADLDFTKQKVDAGAGFAITQMFFDNAYFYRFMDRARRKGITIPILPGIMPITDFLRIREFAAMCKATIPARVERRMSHLLANPEEMRRVGIELAAGQCEDLLSNGFRFLHFYTLNRSDVVREILDAVGGELVAARAAAVAAG
jgi:methylenetetrahydrofolate reductase (NADPH)